MNSEKDIFRREELLLGSSTIEIIARQRVIIFGVGGVGSWCAESLVRSGIQHLTLVDSDVVCASNVNRQLIATSKTIGCVKVEVLKERLLEINPACDITALQAVYCEETSESFQLDTYDYIIDAIDSLKDKAHLILSATQTPARLFSSMGAALKMDSTKISVTEFWKVKGCPLAAALRRKFKHEKTFPSKKFKAVYSEELLKNIGIQTEPRANGTICHATAIFGFTLAGLVIQDIVERGKQI
ncbi:MAG: tRNA threonylcarbamoyladenosine dehydratase [Bacteroidaceae bacterium]|nr:tRNA threonylcarbamoyladenosine dehydratase [Bacteroidaceae bacterium]